MKSARSIEDIRATLRQHLPRLEARYGVVSLRLFGSYVRGDARPDSDLDILVRFEKMPGLIPSIEIENELADLLGIPVDLVIEECLKPRIGQRILAGAVPLWPRIGSFKNKGAERPPRSSDSSHSRNRARG